MQQQDVEFDAEALQRQMMMQQQNPNPQNQIINQQNPNPIPPSVPILSNNPNTAAAQPPVQKPTHQFLKKFPMSIGGYFTCLLLLTRGILFLVTVSKSPEWINLTKTMKVVFTTLGVFDILFSIIGATAIKNQCNFNQFKTYLGYRLGIFCVFGPYLSGYLLFDREMIKEFSLAEALVLLVSGAIVEAGCLYEGYKVMISMLEESLHHGSSFIDILPSFIRPLAQKLFTKQQSQSNINSQRGGPNDPSASLSIRLSASDGAPGSHKVFWNTVPLKYAVSGYAILTLCQSFLGILVLIFFPGIGLSFGFYSSEVKETRSIMLLLDFFGLYFCIASILAMSRGSARYLQIYLYYLLLRFCGLIPVLVTNNLMGDLCGSRHAINSGLGYTSSGNIDMQCNGREAIYIIISCIALLIHGYFVWLTYLLLCHFESDSAEARLRLGLSERGEKGYGTNDIDDPHVNRNAGPKQQSETVVWLGRETF